MRIVVHGQQAFGQRVLEALLERGEDIIAVYCAPEKEGQRPDPLKEAALAHQLPVYQPRSFRKQEVADEFAALQADLCVMAYVTLFVPEEILNLPTYGTIQYHPSLLPRHRGPSSINWPIIWGESKTGLTIFWPDNGLDTGPILLQKEVEIGETDTLGSLYFNQLFPLGVEALLESVDLVRNGTAPKIVQDEARATYESWCKREDVEIDWAKPVSEVWNLIRGADPQPGAWSTYQGRMVQVYDSVKITDDGGATPGVVTAVGDDRFTVAAQGGGIEIQRVRPGGMRKGDASAFIAEVGLRVGDQFGT
jgi:methionyl-tRNA formyltransferase